MALFSYPTIAGGGGLVESIKGVGRSIGELSPDDRVGSVGGRHESASNSSRSERGKESERGQKDVQLDPSPSPSPQSNIPNSQGKPKKPMPTHIGTPSGEGIASASSKKISPASAITAGSIVVYGSEGSKVVHQSGQQKGQEDPEKGITIYGLDQQ